MSKLETVKPAKTPKRRKLGMRAFITIVREKVKSGKYKDAGKLEVSLKKLFPKIHFDHPKIIRLFKRSKSPLLKQIAAKYAIHSKDPLLETEFIKNGSKKVLMRIANSSNVDTLLALSKSKE